MERAENITLFRNTRVRKTVKNVVSYFFLVLFVFFFLFPIFCLLMQSVLPDEELSQFTLFPAYLNFSTYKIALSDLQLLKYFWNTVKLIFLSILGSAVMSSVTAFGLSKVKFKGQDLVFSLILATVFLPSTVTSIPLYAMYLKMGWTTTNYPLWVPLLFGGGAMNIFLMRQFMRGIPKTYSEAAILDGASNFRIYLNIVLPLIKPIFIYLSVQTFFGVWNDFLGIAIHAFSCAVSEIRAVERSHQPDDGCRRADDDSLCRTIRRIPETVDRRGLHDRNQGLIARRYDTVAAEKSAVTLFLRIEV